MERKWLVLRAVVLVLPLGLMLACGLSSSKPTSTIIPVSSTTTSEVVAPLLSTATPEAVSPTSPATFVKGQINSWKENIPITARQIALCQIVGKEGELPADCLLMESSVTTDSEGSFEIAGLPPGRYYVLYNSGRSDFTAALERWAGETLDWEDTQQQAQLFGMEEADEGWVLLLMPEGYMVQYGMGLPYFQGTLLLGDSPFIVAHDIRAAVEDKVLNLVVVEVVEGQPVEVEFPVVVFKEGDYSGIQVRLFMPTPVAATATFVPFAETTTPTPSTLQLGQIKGVLVDKDTGQPFMATLNLFRYQLDTDTEAELKKIQEYLNKSEFHIDEQGKFVFTGVPPGKYALFTTQYGIVTEPFTVSPGETVDLEDVQVDR